MSKKLFIDMDGVLADFMGAVITHPDYGNGKDLDELDVFENLNPIPKSIESVNKIIDSGKYDVFILSTAPWGNPKAWMDKRLWIEKYLPKLKKRLILSHYKDLCCGSDEDIIIDDRICNGVERWGGVHLHFGPSGEYPNWETILEVLNV
jgi:5'(3')-deoxyribonucleotidase